LKIPKTRNSRKREQKSRQTKNQNTMKKNNTQKIKWTIMLFLACFAFSGLKAQNTLSQYKQSFKLTEIKKGTKCQNEASLNLKFKNITNETMDFQYGIQDKNGKWQTGLIPNIAPGNETGDITQCESNGRYKWWARPTSKSAEYKFPAQADLNK
jgi:hypothetical protein